jgi:proteasome lid subunit RPN8/RPN11
MAGQSQALLLPRAVREEMLAHVNGDPEREVCGLLGGEGRRASRYYPAVNIAPEPAREFLLEPGAQIAAMRAMRERGESLLGIFHSHPDSPAVPSARDLAMAAYPDTIYVIAAPGQDRIDLNAFYYDGYDFAQIDIQITEK